MNKKCIRILSSLPRAGGTLVSRCIGAMDGIVLLSEIHPLGAHLFDPLQQARDWYGLFRPGELGNEKRGFVETIRLIEERCSADNRTLVIRDWAHLDFIGIPFLDKPGYRPQLTGMLAQDFEIRQYALVRHPVDQWVSMSRLRVLQGRLGLDAFLAGCRRFAEQSCSTGFMRYEDFTRDPEKQMQLLCRRLALEYDGKFLDRWYRNTSVTGDISGMSRGSGTTAIMPLERLPAGRALMDRFRANPDYHRIIQLLDYDDDI